MKKKRFDPWQVLYPVAIYYVVMSLSYYGLEIIFGVTTNENYMVRQLLCAVAAIPFVLRFYLADRKIRTIVYGKKNFKLDRKQIKDILLTVVTVGIAAAALNNLIAMTPMVDISQGFQTANKAFFGGSILFQLLGSCVVIPIAEELVFRGVVYQRLRLQFDMKKALLGSALIFGIVHTNLVQLVYASILGVLLAFLYEKSGFLYIPVIGHIAANTIAVVRTATGWLSFSYDVTAAGIMMTLALVVISVGLIWYQVREYRTENREEKKE